VTTVTEVWVGLTLLLTVGLLVAVVVLVGATSSYEVERNALRAERDVAQDALQGLKHSVDQFRGLVDDPTGKLLLQHLYDDLLRYDENQLLVTRRHRGVGGR